MTPAELVARARSRYNAIGDGYYSDDELFDAIYEAQMALAIETECIEKRYSTSTVVSQREYQFPSTMIRVDRITYDGVRLDPIDFVEDDTITWNDEDTTSTGAPRFYALYNDTIFLRPVPNEIKTLKINAVCEPGGVSLTSTLDVPTRYHIFIVDFMLSNMFAKDGNQQMASYHREKWEQSIATAKRWEMKRLVSDQYKQVKSDETVPFHGRDYY